MKKANRPCKEPGCVAYAVPRENFCAKHYVTRGRSKPAQSWRREYGSSRWVKARAAYLQRHPLCVACEQEGKLVSAGVVDHINPHRGDMQLFWDTKNWQALCKPCHDRKTASEDGGFGNKKRGCQVYSQAQNAPIDGRVFVVDGAPCSGKSTFVTEQLQSSDLVVDLDYIIGAISGKPQEMHHESDILLPIALDVRDFLVDIVRKRAGSWRYAFVVTASPHLHKVQQLATTLGAEVITMQTTKTECLSRLQTDPTRVTQIELFTRLIYEWFSARGEGGQISGGWCPGPWKADKSLVW